MSYRMSANPAFKDKKSIELNEEFNNFMKRVGEVSAMVKDMASGDKEKAEKAKVLADRFLEGKVLIDDDVKLTVKENRTVVNTKAFKSLEKNGTNEMDKDAWMTEVSKDAERRAEDRKIRREKADTLKTQAMKAYRRGEFDKALSCFNKAIEHVKDNSMLYCDRALTNIKLGKYEKVFHDCDLAIRLNESSYKARLYKAKAHKEMEEIDQMEECKKELEELYPQHHDLTEFFLEKVESQENVEEEEEEED